MTEVAASRDEIEELRRECKRAIEEADVWLARIDDVLRESRERRERIMDNLRRAGLLRD